jgi:hypothetical protein
VLTGFAEQLASSPDPRAVELRAEALIGSLASLGMLGRSEQQEAVFEELAALGAPAIGACDSIVARIAQRAQPSGFLATIPFFKAALLLKHDEHDTGIAVLCRFVKDFGDSQEPVFKALVHRAKQILEAQ